MDNTLAHQLEALVSKIILKTEHQNELLFGSCQSTIRLTNTQEHILMLLAQDEDLTNSDLSRELGISQAAVTKALKALMAKDMLTQLKDEKDGRVFYYRLTAQAKPLAEEHTYHHQHTHKIYEELLADFSSSDQEVIERFLASLSRKLDGEG